MEGGDTVIETMLIWLGSGFAFSVGMMCGIALMLLFGRQNKAENQRSRDDLNEAWRRRNETADKERCAMDRVATALERMAPYKAK